MKPLLLLTGLFLTTTILGQSYFSLPNVFSTGNLQFTCGAITGGDIDGDGDADVVSGVGYSYQVVKYENLDGAGNFSEEINIGNATDGIHSFHLIDIDNDGDKDLLYISACPTLICWFRNLDGLGNFSGRNIIASPGNTWHLSGACPADVDQDGHVDVVVANSDDGSIIWYRNTDGKGNFELQPFIAIFVYGASDVISADVDGDNDPDVISAAGLGEFISWHENIDGHGTFDGELKMISDTSTWVSKLAAADLDGDTDTDVAFADHAGVVGWYENLDGEGNFGPHKIILDTLASISQFMATDIDDDGDMDLMVAQISNNKIVFLENTDVPGHFVMQEISIDSPYSLFASDIDGDGDPDLLTSSYNLDEIEYLKNINLKILTQPLSYSSCTGQPVSFSTEVRDCTGYQWQLNMGTEYFNLTDDNIFSGTATPVLQVAMTSPAMSGFSFRCCVSNDRYTLYTDEVNLNIGDTEPPVISGYPPGQTVYADDSCHAFLADYSAMLEATDNCDSGLIILQSPAPGTPLSGVVNPVNLTAKDHSGNESQVNFNVTVRDTLFPGIICPEDKTIDLDPGKDAYTVAGKELDPLRISDNCQVKSILNDLNNTATLEGQVLPAGTTTIHWTVTDESDNKTTCRVTVTANQVEPNFSIYPNPTKDKLYFQFPGYDLLSITVTNPDGKMLLRTTLDPETDFINLAPLPSGLYFIRIVANENVITRKVVKR